MFFFFKQKTAYEMRISDWSSDVCSSDLNGDSVRADRVLLATGGAARRLPLAGADAPNVHHLRTKDDADHLAKDLVAGARIVVIGMGVIGAEVAASARKAGCQVKIGRAHV